MPKTYVAFVIFEELFMSIEDSKVESGWCFQELSFLSGSSNSTGLSRQTSGYDTWSIGWSAYGACGTKLVWSKIKVHQLSTWVS